MKKLLFVMTCVSMFSLSVWAKSPKSPFDDLSADEIKNVIHIIKDSGKFDSDIRFPVIRQKEPAKALWLKGEANDHRQAYAAIFDFKKSLMTEIVVDLKSEKILSTKDLPGIKPPVLIEEYERARKLVLSNEEWKKAILSRGLKIEDVLVDVWAPGLMRAAELKPGQRLLRGVTYIKKHGKNFYSRPVEGVLATVDLSQNKVISVLDVGAKPIAPMSKEFDEASNGPIDQSLKPLISSQPNGPSYQIDGQEITWSKWKFRYSMDPLQGLQIQQVRFDDGTKERSILYKISLAEMLVPYGDPQKTWSFRNAFDVGEYGLGKTLHPLELGKDVPAIAQLLDVVLSDDLGNEPITIKGVAIYEKDGGLLWKHRNAENGDTDLRKNRQLVMTFMTTIGNYDYGINYIFNLDGTIKIDVQLTGILLAKGTEITQNPCIAGCNPLVEKLVLAPNHQHFFNFRIDFDVDGAAGNTPAEMNVEAIKSRKENPDGNGFAMINTVLATEKNAQRNLHLPTARKWKVFNRESKNSLGHPRGYALMPEESAVPYLTPDNQIRKRAQFINHHAWFTAFNDDEMSAAALFPTTAPMGEGLPKYIANDEKLDGQDVVMWYTFGVTHVPRPEEWPIMNVHHTGFTLMPVNFFSENQGMKVPEKY